MSNGKVKPYKDPAYMKVYQQKWYQKNRDNILAKKKQEYAESKQGTVINEAMRNWR